MPDDETDELDPSVATDSQDERDTPEDYLAMMKAALLANETMRRKEASLPTVGATTSGPVQWPQMPARTPPTNLAEALGLSQPGMAPDTQAAPVAPPVPPQAPGMAMPRNRMYMGPMVGAPNATPQQFFGDTPNNTLVAPPAPPAGAAQYDQGVASGLIQPPSRRLTPTDTAFTPAYEQWAAQQDLRAAVDRGVPIDKASLMYPGAYGGTSRPVKDTERVVGPGQTLYRNGQPVGTVPPKVTPAPKTPRYTPAQASALYSKIETAEAANGGKPVPLSKLKPQLLAIIQGGAGAENQAQATEGTPVTDKNGKNWLYTGTAADPKDRPRRSLLS